MHPAAAWDGTLIQDGRVHPSSGPERSISEMAVALAAAQAGGVWAAPQPSSGNGVMHGKWPFRPTERHWREAGRPGVQCITSRQQQQRQQCIPEV